MTADHNENVKLYQQNIDVTWNHILFLLTTVVTLVKFSNPTGLQVVAHHVVDIEAPLQV